MKDLIGLDEIIQEIQALADKCRKETDKEKKKALMEQLKALQIKLHKAWDV